MGNFEKLSVLVIGVIIVMILVVALYTWTDDPAAETADLNVASTDVAEVTPPPMPEIDPAPGGGWADSAWVDDEVGADGVDDEVVPVDGLDTDDAEDEPLETEDAVDPAPTAEKTVTVKPGETLSEISLRELGKAGLWKLIADRNDISDPGKVRAGTVLVIPSISRAAPTDNKAIAAVSSGTGPEAGVEYTVRGGDTIQKISQSAFGTIERWTDIWFANFERIEDPRFLRQGMKLAIPN